MIISNSVRNFKLEKFEKGSTIIKHGDPGRIFYILIKGKVDIYIPSEIIVEYKDA